MFESDSKFKETVALFSLLCLSVCLSVWWHLHLSSVNPKLRALLCSSSLPIAQSRSPCFASMCCSMLRVWNLNACLNHAYSLGHRNFPILDNKRQNLAKEGNKVRNIAGCVEVNVCFFLPTFLHLSIAIWFKMGSEETSSLSLFTINYCSVLSHFNPGRLAIVESGSCIKVAPHPRLESRSAVRFTWSRCNLYCAIWTALQFLLTNLLQLQW